MSFFEELKRRNVVRVGVAYGIASWVLLQVADLVLENIEAPPWVIQALMLVVLLGFVAALVIAWAYELTPEGIKKEADVDRTQSIVGQTGKKLDRIIIAFLVLAVGVLLVERQIGSGSSADDRPGNATAATASDAAGPAPTEVSTESAQKSGNAIAVLPFANRSLQEGDLFFTDGIHDDLLTQLAKIDGLKVISRTSVMEYRDTTKKIPEIAAELGVGKILEGGVQRAGSRVRINAQLINVATDEHLWAETFDREMTIDNIFDIQSEITRQIVSAIKGELTDADQRALAESPTDNVEAYEAYLRARAATLQADYVAENYIRAEPWAQRAVELDPAFAEAWALLVEIHGQAFWMGYDRSPERRALAEKALEMALRLRPESPVVMAARADFHYRFDGDYEQALQYFLEARAAAPGDSRIHVFTAITQRRAGHWEDAVDSFEKALELDPSNSFVVNQLIDTLIWMNRYDRVRYLTETYVLRFPNSRDLRSYQVRLQIQGYGDLAKARQLMDQMEPWPGSFYVLSALDLARLERDYPRVLSVLDSPMEANLITQWTGEGAVQLLRGEAHHLAGDRETARVHFEQAIETLRGLNPEGKREKAQRWNQIANALAYLGDSKGALESSHTALSIFSREEDHLFGTRNEQDHTRILAMAGHRDEALQRLEARVDQPEGYSRWELHLDPRWDFFRDDPRFVALATPEGVTR